MTACIPLPLQIVIDDVGWWSGRDGHAAGEPYRTGMTRDHVPADYAAIVSLGRRLGLRPQAAMVLCEWDREDLLRAVPTATWMGPRWTNRRWRGPWLDEAAEIIRRGADHFEVTLHGVGHEFWRNGAPSRAEWHDEEGRLRPVEAVEAHIEAFARILEQNGLGPFPESFVPAAFRHRFGGGLAGLLRKAGVRYISTPFATMHRDRPPEERLFGVDEGLMTVDRGTGSPPWDAAAPRPEADLDGPLLGLHWPNVLHPDPERNEAVVDRWVRRIAPVGARADRVLARDTAEAWTQLAYHVRARVLPTGDGLALDFAGVDALGAVGLRETFVLTLSGAPAEVRASAGLEILSDEPAPGGAFRRLRLRRRGGTRGRLRFGAGPSMPHSTAGDPAES